MAKFYFTYGESDDYFKFPFKGGWTIVEAEDENKARAIFSCYHYDYEHHMLNCSCIYPEEDFKKTSMYRNGENLGAGLHEVIRVERIKVN